MMLYIMSHPDLKLQIFAVMDFTLMAAVGYAWWKVIKWDFNRRGCSWENAKRNLGLNNGRQMDTGNPVGKK